ncbi:MAG: ABC transporter ATP-binding protein [Clostridia bacterium]|nr:ABC transporter ATP-binding protein [Clostridia bacterium]NLS86100.1 ABC transporter ATP-binding protein [Oscillospiraceae bacterium]
MSAIIRVEKLRKIYLVGTQKVAALNNVSLEIEKGEFCCIVGASGSGKSTLLNQLAGLEKPTSGSVYIGKNNISAMTESELAKFRQNHLGFVFQSYNLLQTMTAAENVALPLMFKGVPKQKRELMAAKQLAKLGLGKRIHHKPSEMSGGQQQRVGIARAFVTKPKVIFADEPTGNLDSTTTAKVMNVMLKLARENNITVIMVTHERDLAGCADRIITLKDGKVVGNEKIENPNEEFIPAEMKNVNDALPPIKVDEPQPEQAEASELPEITPEEAAQLISEFPPEIPLDDDEKEEEKTEEKEDDSPVKEHPPRKNEPPKPVNKPDELITAIKKGEEQKQNDDEHQPIAELPFNTQTATPLSAEEFLP